MALSNWDTMAVDKTGKPTNGLFVTPLGVRAEIYKNWLYVHDEKAWRDGGSFVNDTVMSIQHGEITYFDLNVLSIRHENSNGIFVVAWNGYEHRKNLEMMFGIGCYGFSGEQWVGVTEETKSDFKDWLKQMMRDHMLPISELPNFDNSKRFNQGDAYFVGAKAASTDIGKVDKPLILKALNL